MPVRILARGKISLELFGKRWKIRNQFGAKQAQKLFYWNHQDVVSVSPQKCYATLLKHLDNGVLAFVSNLSSDIQSVAVKFNLKRLDLDDRTRNVFNVPTEQPVAMSSHGKVSMPLASETWVYLWLRPNANE